MRRDRSIRPYAPSDLPRLQAIRKAAFAPIFAGFEAQVGADIASIAFADADADQAKLLDEICGSGQTQVLACATGEEIAGFVTFTIDAERRTGEIGLNAVDPGEARRGIGTMLYQAAIERMASEGVAVVSVSTGGDAAHEPARRAYEKLGFGSPIPSLSLCKLIR